MTALNTLEFDTGPEPKTAIAIMHGLGADASDFQPFVHEIDLASIGPVRWIFPNAPRLPVSLNGGYVMPAWYDIYPDRSREDEAGLRHAQGLVNAVLAREVARGIPAHRIVLGGFSQGCAMALLTGLRYPERLAGIVGMSGYLPLAQALTTERSAANRDVPIFLAHGSQDEMVPLASANAARALLHAQGYNVQWHQYRMGHSVCLEEIRDLQTWLQQVLAA
jgi:phospholipase/carboxylesterase